MIKDLLIGKNARERANIKGLEIAKIKAVPRKNVKFSNADYDIEIVDTKAIPNGVEILARAWDSNGQIGFGKDGTVDIERFRFINPPIMVPDPNGDVIREWEHEDAVTKEKSPRQRKLREDPELAIRQSIGHVIKVKKQKFGSERIIQGKIGNTTTTVYPDASTGGTTVDGRTSYIAVDTWANVRNAASGGHNDTEAQQSVARAGLVGGGNFIVARDAFLFDTSAIPDTDTIDSATISFFGNTVQATANADSTSLNVVSTAPASNNDLVDADYAIANWGSTVFGSFALSGWSTSAYNDVTLDSNGLANISKTGISKFGTRIALDVSNTEPAGDNHRNTDFADASGTSTDPKLVVEHSAAVAGGTTIIPRRMLMGIGA